MITFIIHPRVYCSICVCACAHVCIIYIYGSYFKIRSYYPCQGVRCFFQLVIASFYVHKLLFYLIPSPYSSFTDCLPNIHCGWFAQIRPQLRTTHWIWMLNSWASGPVICLFSWPWFFELIRPAFRQDAHFLDLSDSLSWCYLTWSPTLYFFLTTGSSIGLMNSFYWFFY